MQRGSYGTSSFEDVLEFILDVLLFLSEGAVEKSNEGEL